MPEIPPASPPPSTPPPDDPITSYSFTFPLLIASLLLIVTVAWSFWDEVYGLRPWRSYQSRFSSAYSKYLDKAVQNQKKQEDAVYSSPEYKKLSAQVDDLQKSTKAQDEDIAKQIALLDEQRAALGDAFKDARGKIGHLVYQYEIVPPEDKNSKAKALKEVTDGRKEIWKVDWPLGDGKIQRDKPFTADELP